MLDVVLEKIPVRTSLSDKVPCSIRPMELSDEFAFRELRPVIPDSEHLFIKTEIKDGTRFRKWMDDPEYGKHPPLLAFVDVLDLAKKIKRFKLDNIALDGAHAQP